MEQAEQRAERAEAAARKTEIRLEILRAKITDIERHDLARKKSAAAFAVEMMVKAGAVKSDDVWAKDNFQVQFIHDPGLVDLLFLKPANRKKI